MIDVLLKTGHANARPILIFLFFTLIASNPPHYMHPPLSLRVFPLIADFSLGDWLCLKGVPVPAVLIPDLPPHRGLDPRSPANINTEELRHRDYNQKKTLLLCVSVFIQRNKRMRLRVKPATRSKTPSLSGRAGEGLIITLHSTLYTLNSKL